MCPTASERGVGVYQKWWGDKRSVKGPWQRLSLNPDGYLALIAAKAPEDVGRAIGNGPTSVWGVNNDGKIVFVFGVNTLLTVDPKKDDWFE